MKRTFLQGSFAVVAGLLALVALWQLGGQQALARPQYMKAFKMKYAGYKVEKAEACNLCHVGTMDKKTRNDYGKAVGKAIGAKNCKDDAKIEGGLTAAEGEKDPNGTAFGDLIKDNKLPITK